MLTLVLLQQTSLSIFQFVNHLDSWIWSSSHTHTQIHTHTQFFSECCIYFLEKSFSVSLKITISCHLFISVHTESSEIMLATEFSLKTWHWGVILLCSNPYPQCQPNFMSYGYKTAVYIPAFLSKCDPFRSFCPPDLLYAQILEESNCNKTFTLFFYL